MADQSNTEFDRLIGALKDLPDVVSTKLSTLRIVPMLGIGPSKLYAVQSYRQRDEGDVIFLECVSDKEVTRLVLPAA